MGRSQEKETAEVSRRISIWWLKKHGFLGGFKSGTMSWTYDHDESSKSSISIQIDTEDQFIRFIYTQTSYYGDEKREMNYTHGLVSTLCNYGGKRYWFECHLTSNGRYCGRRVGVLYKSPGSWYWGCRHCHRITYESRRINHDNFFCKIINLETRVENLEQLVKRKTWRGKPTKRYKRLLRLYAIYDRYLPSLG